jgi:hypothetical protein
MEAVLYMYTYFIQVSGDVYAYAERVICLKTYTLAWLF